VAVNKQTSDAFDARAVGPGIRMLLPTLTPLEASVVSGILARKSFDEKTSLKEVAAEAAVSEAMVVKITKKLGYSGFREFRARLAEYNRLPIATLHQDVSPNDTPSSIVEKVFRTAVKALEDTLAILDIAACETAIDRLHTAKQRDFYGLGGSAQLARDVAHKFLRIGVRASVFDDAHMMLMSATLLDSSDVVMAFSHSGETTAVLEAIELARQNGATVIAVTNSVGSHLADEADIVLCSTAQGSPLLGENAAARIAQLVILDAIFVGVAQQSMAAAEQNLERTMTAVRLKRKVR